MKAFKKIIKSLSTAALLTGLAVNFNACSEQSPLSSNTEIQAKNKEIQILRYQDASQAKLSKVVSVSEMVSVQNGGQLSIDNLTNSGSRIQITLDVAAGSINQDAMLSMSLDDELLIVTFNVPSGVSFSQTPTLTIVAQGLNSGNFNVEDLNVYCENNGQWQPLPGGSVTGGSQGSINATGGFGGGTTEGVRYAIGAE